MTNLLIPNTRIQMDGMEFLLCFDDNSVPVAFLDPQYRGVLDKLAYGNEGDTRGKRRKDLVQMDDDRIRKFVMGIDRVLKPSGHLFLWVDKFHLCEGFHRWLKGSDLMVVDMVTWDKGTFGMGYRTRRCVEYCVILQKEPRRAKGVWTDHGIPDILREKVSRKDHPHTKPVELQGRLLSAVTEKGDVVIDPAAGSFSVMDSALKYDRTFFGCDLNG